MKRLKTTVALAFTFAFWFSGQAAAQTVPTLAVSAGASNGFGATVTIEWSALPLAQGYTLEAGTASGLANIATVNLPASVTRVVVFAPNGTYYVRVRGFAGALVGDYSAEQAVDVGGPATCSPLAAPTVAATNSSHLSVKVDWTPVAGAIGYMVEYSRFNGSTEFAEPVGPTVNSVTKYAGFPGDFFVRVVAHSACGDVAASAYTPFTIINSGGPRTPDPAPGHALPLPPYGAAVVEAVAAQFPGDLHNSCVEHGGNNVFMFRVVQALRQYDSRWGLNWKRGNRGDLSQDIVTYNYGPGTDEDTINVYIIDMIASHCTSRPGPTWIDQTEVTREGGGIGRWTLEPYLRAGFPPDGRQ